MKAYKIEVGKVTEEGRYAGRETVGYVGTKEKVEAKKEAYKAEHQIYEYWMRYETENHEIKFYVEEITIE